MAHITLGHGGDLEGILLPHTTSLAVLEPLPTRAGPRRRADTPPMLAVRSPGGRGTGVSGAELWALASARSGGAARRGLSTSGFCQAGGSPKRCEFLDIFNSFLYEVDIRPVHVYAIGMVMELTAQELEALERRLGLAPGGAERGEPTEVARLERVDPAGLDDFEILERLGAVGRVRAQADGVLVELTGELSRRRGALAARAHLRERLRVAGYEARRTADLAEDLTERGLGETLEALCAGEITAGHARLIARSHSRDWSADEADLLRYAKRDGMDRPPVVRDSCSTTTSTVRPASNSSLTIASLPPESAARPSEVRRESPLWRT